MNEVTRNNDLYEMSTSCYDVGTLQKASESGTILHRFMCGRDCLDSYMVAVTFTIDTYPECFSRPNPSQVFLLEDLLDIDQPHAQYFARNYARNLAKCLI
jgi:hypothetical protein